MKDALSGLLDWATSGSAWLILLAMWGGSVRYLSQLRKEGRVFKLTELIVELAVSGFAGLLAGYVCYEADASWAITCFVVGVSGHMGGQTLALFEAKVKQFFTDAKD